MDDKNQPPPVAFEGEEFQRSVPLSQTRTPRVVVWVMQYSGGLITNEKQAQHVLVGFVLIATVAAFLLVLSGGGNTAKFEAPRGQKIIYPENGPPRLEQNFNL